MSDQPQPQPAAAAADSTATPTTQQAPPPATNNNENTNNNNNAASSPAPAADQQQNNTNPVSPQGQPIKDDGAPLDFGPSMDVGQFQSPKAGAATPTQNSVTPTNNSNAAGKQQPGTATPQQQQGSVAAPPAAASSAGTSRKAPSKIHPAEEPPTPARPVPIPEHDIPPRLRGLYGKAELLFYSVVIRRTASGLFNKNKPGLVFLTPSALFILDMSFMVTRYVPVGEIASPCGVYEQTKQVLLKPVNDVEILISFPDPNSPDLDDNSASMARACGNRGLGQFIRCLYAAHFFAHRPADVPAACNPPLRLTKMPPDVMLKSLSRSARSSPSSSDRQAKIEMRLKNEMNKKEGITRPHAAQQSTDDANNNGNPDQQNGDAARDQEGAGAQNNFQPDMKLKQLAENYVSEDEQKRQAALAAEKQNDGMVEGPNGERVPPVVALAQKYAADDKNKPNARAQGEFEDDEEEEYEEEEDERSSRGGSSQRSRGSSVRDPNLYFKPERELEEYFDPKKQELRVSGRGEIPRIKPPPMQKPPQDNFAMMAFVYACGVRVIQVNHNYTQPHPLERVPAGETTLLTVSTTGTAVFWALPRGEQNIWQFNVKEDVMMFRFEKNAEATIQIRGAQGAAPLWIRLAILIHNPDKKSPQSPSYVPADWNNYVEDEDDIQDMMNILARGLLFCHPQVPCEYVRAPPPPPKPTTIKKQDSMHSQQSAKNNNNNNAVVPAVAVAPLDQQQDRSIHQDPNALNAQQQQLPNQMSATNFASPQQQNAVANIGQQQSQPFLSGAQQDMSGMQSTPVGQQFARTGALPRVKPPGNRESLQMMALCYASFVRVADFSLPEHLARTPSGAPHPIMPYLLQSVLFTINPTGNAIFWRPMVEAPLWSFNALHDVEAIHFRRGGLISILVRPYGGRSQPCKMTIQPMLYRPNIGGVQDPDELKTIEADITIPAEREELIRSAKSLLEVLHALAPNVQFTVDRPDSSSRTTSIATSARDGSSQHGSSTHPSHSQSGTGDSRHRSDSQSSQHTGSDRANATGPSYRPRGGQQGSRSESGTNPTDYTSEHSRSRTRTNDEYTNDSRDHRSHSQSDHDGSYRTGDSQSQSQSRTNEDSHRTPRSAQGNPQKSREMKNDLSKNNSQGNYDVNAEKKFKNDSAYPMDSHAPINDDGAEAGHGDDWDHEKGRPRGGGGGGVDRNRGGREDSRDRRTGSYYSEDDSRYDGRDGRGGGRRGGGREDDRDRRGHRGHRDDRGRPHHGNRGYYDDDQSDYSQYSRSRSRGGVGRHPHHDNAVAAVLRDVPLAHSGQVQPIHKDVDVPVDAVKIMSEVDWRSIIQQDPVTAATVMADAQQQWEMERAAIAHELLRMHEERSLLLGQNDALQHQIAEILEGRGNVVGDVQKLSQQCFQLQQQLQAERKIRQQSIDDNVYKTERFFEGVIISQQDEVDVLKERLRRLEGVLERVGDAAGSAPKFKYNSGGRQQQQDSSNLPPPNMTIGSDGPFSPSAIGFHPSTSSNRNNNISVQYPPGTTSGPMVSSPLSSQQQQQQGMMNPSSPQNNLGTGVSPPRSAAQQQQVGNNNSNNNGFFSPNSLQFPPHQQQQTPGSSMVHAPPNSPYYGGPSPPKASGSTNVQSPYATPGARAALFNSRNSPGSGNNNDTNQSLRYSLMMDT